MSLGTNHTSTTTAASFIPSIWAPKVNDFFRAELKAASFFEDWSGEIADGGNVIYVPNMSEMTANAITVGGTGEVTLNNQTMGKITLTVNAHYEVSFVIGDDVASSFLRSYMIQEKWMTNAGFTAASKLEVALLALFDGFSQTVGASHLSLNDSNIRAAMLKLDLANVPQSDRMWFLHPQAAWDVMGINKYSLLVNTNGADPVTKGMIGYLYGIPVTVTTNIQVGTNVASTKGARENALAHKSALSFAVSNIDGMNPVRLQASYIQEYLGTLYTADIFYGVIENRDAAGVLVMTLSA